MIRRLIILLLIVGLFAEDSNKKTSTQYFGRHFSLGITAAYPDLLLGIRTSSCEKELLSTNFKYDIKLNQNTSIFIFLGLPTLFGSGISWQQNYNHNSWVFSLSGGFNPWVAQHDGWLYNSAITYQWNIWNKPTYLSIGMHVDATQIYGDFTFNEQGQNTGNEIEWLICLFPLISIDKRF